jgi:hypothetical protein
MQSHTSKVKLTSSTSHTPGSHAPDAVTQDHQRAHRTADRTYKRKARRDGPNPPSMLLDPIDSSSSDTKSFDEDDMYGSDSGVETISLKPDSKEEARSTNEYMVCNCHIRFIPDLLLSSHIRSRTLNLSLNWRGLKVIWTRSRSW